MVATTRSRAATCTQNETDSSVKTEASVPSSIIKSPPKKCQKSSTEGNKNPVTRFVQCTLQPRKNSNERNEQDSNCNECNSRQHHGSPKEKSTATVVNAIVEDSRAVASRQEEKEQCVKKTGEPNWYDKNVVLVYPFMPDTQRDNQLSKDLFGGIDTPANVVPSPLMGDSNTGSVTILKSDLARLEPGRWLSDSNMDFWIRFW